MLRPSAVWLGWATLALWVLTILLWMLHVGGHDLPAAVSRLTVVLAVVSSTAWLGLGLARSLRGKSGRDRWVALLLPALLLLSLAVRFTGLSHEVDGRYYLDEGTYYHHASAIDEGKWLRLSPRQRCSRSRQQLRHCCSWLRNQPTLHR